MAVELPPWTADWWQPIETAPQDGTWVLTLTPSRVPQQCVLRWVPGATREQSKWQEGDGRWYVFGPTHWMPLPPALIAHQQEHE